MFTCGPALLGINFKGALNAYTSGLWGAYSLKRLLTSYNGASFNVRSSAGGTQDIGFNSNGSLNTTALSSFLGSNSGYVTKWYDQSGAGHDIANATANNQPRIYLSGVYDGILRFETAQGGQTGNLFSSANSSSGVTVFHAFMYGNIVNFSTTQVLLEQNSADTTNDCVFFADSSNSKLTMIEVQSSSGANRINRFATTFQWTSIGGADCLWDSTSTSSATALQLGNNGSTVASGDTTSSNSTPFSGGFQQKPWFLGARNNASNFSTLHAKSLVIYEVSQAANRSAINTAIIV